MNLLLRIKKSASIRFNRYRSNRLNLKAGWRSENPVLVIESDDWGAEHIPSRDILKKSPGLGENLSEYDFDGLESTEDIEELCATLRTYRNAKGNSAVITANFIMANPDYRQIQKNNFKKFIYKRIDDGFNHETDIATLWKSYRKAIDSGVFVPQFHGLLHFNVKNWMERLQNHDPDTINAFNLTMIGGEQEDFGIGIRGMEPAYHTTEDELHPLIEEGMKIFKVVFGFTSFTSIAPCYAWISPQTELLFTEFGIRAVQGKEFQYLPDGTMEPHYTGQYGPGGILYLTRNCILEPTVGKTTADGCFEQIVFAFKNKLPAIICSHRINYTSRVDRRVRNLGLKILSDVLRKVVQYFPEVEFLSSEQLAKRILKASD